MPLSKLANRLGRAYLYYLSILPALGTLLFFTVFDADNTLFNFFGFILGIAAVSVYVSMMALYSPSGTSTAKNLLAFVDGPIWAYAIIALGGRLTLYDFAVSGVLIEIVGVFLGILFALPLGPVPKKERMNVGTLVALPGLGMLLLSYFFFKNTDSLSIITLITFTVAVLQSAITYRQNIFSGKIRHEVTPITVVGLVAWVIAFFVGLALSH